MIFQTLDDKKECVGVYSNNELVFKKLPDGLTKTWSYSPFLKGKKIEYASLFCEGKTLEEVCPENLKEEFEANNKKIKSFLNSFKESKIDLKQNCMFDLIPLNALTKYCEVRNKITESVFQSYEKPKEYEFYSKFNELITDIKFQKLNLNFDTVQSKLYKESSLKHYRKLLNVNPYIHYNMFGSVTGRLTTKKNSFPIQTFNKSLREALVPKNDWFVQFDVNAAEMRMALALFSKPQPKEDLYQWISKDIFNEELSREESKSIAIKWLYNSSEPLEQKHKDALESYFNKSALEAMYYVDGFIHTPFSRKIEADQHHAISYLNQSSFIDLFHRQILKVYDLLKEKKSFISFMLHDELVLDVTDDEKYLILEIAKLLKQTKYGEFKVSVKAGKNYGELKKLKLEV
jgi:hypothetical protein